MRIAIISDGIPGHFNQSIGVANLLAEDIPNQQTIFKMVHKFPLMRSITRLYLRHLFKSVKILKIEKILDIYYPLNLKDFDLIIASGGNTSFITAALSKKYNIPSIQIGSLRGLKSIYFAAHITIEPDINSSSNIVTLLAPNKYKPNLQRNKMNKNKALFLLGGDGAGYTYSMNDWEELEKNIKHFESTTGIKPLIVTSRRTNKIHEDYLYNEMKTYCDSKSIWFHRGGESADLDEMFDDSDFIYVTEDSAMMITESVSSGLSVSTLSPKRIKSDTKYENMLLRLEANNLINRLSFKSNLQKDSYYGNEDKIFKIRELLKKNIMEKISL